MMAMMAVTALRLLAHGWAAMAARDLIGPRQAIVPARRVRLTRVARHGRAGPGLRRIGQLAPPLLEACARRPSHEREKPLQARIDDRATALTSPDRSSFVATSLDPESLWQVALLFRLQEAKHELQLPAEDRIPVDAEPMLRKPTPAEVPEGTSFAAMRAIASRQRISSMASEPCQSALDDRAKASGIVLGAKPVRVLAAFGLAVLACVLSTSVFAEASKIIIGAQAYPPWGERLGYAGKLPITMVRLIIEPEKVYDPASGIFISSGYLSGLNAGMATLHANGIKVLLTITGGARATSELPDPAVWAAATRMVVEHYQKLYPGIFTGVEVGNEPNGTWNYGLPTAAEQGEFTARLTKSIHDEIGRSATAAGVPIIGGATIGIYGRKVSAFWEAAFRAGLLNSVNGLSFHYYNDTDDLLTRVPELRRAIAAHGGAPDLPLYLTECCAAMPEKAYRASRGPTLAVAAGLNAMIYFLMMDEPAIGWPVQGLVTTAGELKPPAAALARWVELFEGATFTRVDLGPDVIAFDASNGIRIAWSPDGATIAVDSSVEVEDMYRNPLPRADRYELGNDPIYIFSGN